MHNAEMQNKVIRMRAEGQSVRSIAEVLQISPTTVQQWSKEFAADIQEAHKLELEAVLEDINASKLQRIRTLGLAFKKIERHIQTSENVRQDMKMYYYLLRLDKYIKNEIMYEFPPVPAKHVCPAPVIKFLTNMPFPGQFPENYFDAPEANRQPRAGSPESPDAQAHAQDSDTTGSHDATSADATDAPTPPDDTQPGAAPDDDSASAAATSPASQYPSADADDGSGFDHDNPRPGQRYNFGFIERRTIPNRNGFTREYTFRLPPFDTNRTSNVPVSQKPFGKTRNLKPKT